MSLVAGDQLSASILEVEKRFNALDPHVRIIVGEFSWQRKGRSWAFFHRDQPVKDASLDTKCAFVALLDDFLGARKTALEKLQADLDLANLRIKAFLEQP